METTIDRAGRIVVPKTLRESLGLSAGTRVEITASGDGLLLRPVGPETRVVHRRGRPVLEAEGPVEPLTVDAVRELVERGRH